MREPSWGLSVFPSGLSILVTLIWAVMLSLSGFLHAAGYSTHPSMLDASQRYKDGDKLEGIWDLWHNRSDPDNRSKAARNKQREMFQTFNLADELRRHSHNYYILEAKMGLSREQDNVNPSDLLENNAGLSAFRAGVKLFFMEKDYLEARRVFADAIFLSAKLNDQDRKQLFELTQYVPLEPLTSDETQFNQRLVDYFIEADLAAKNVILDHIESKRLPDKDLLNLYWALGTFIVTNNQYQTEFTDAQVRAGGQKSLYLRLNKRFGFSTVSNSIWFPWF